MEFSLKVRGPTTVDLYDGDKFVGSVSQNPDSHEVKDPGKWTATIHTKDGGIWSLGAFDNEASAALNALEGLLRDWTYEQWKAEEDKARAEAAA